METDISPGPYERVQVGDVILFVGNDLSRQEDAKPSTHQHQTQHHSQINLHYKDLSGIMVLASKKENPLFSFHYFMYPFFMNFFIPASYISIKAPFSSSYKYNDIILHLLCKTAHLHPLIFFIAILKLQQSGISVPVQ